MKRLLQRASKAGLKALKNTHRTFRFETLETRQMMFGGKLPDYTAPEYPTTVAPEDPPPAAEGNIQFNATNGVLTVDGSAHNDRIRIYINRRSGNGAGDLPDLLTVEIANINYPRVQVFDPLAVRRIVVNGLDGNDRIDNRTSIGMSAFGGAGHDVILGGIADDYIYGGGDDDYLDGRRGDDILQGQSGHDALFGDSGWDSLYGGTGDDRLFGGFHDDSLYGEDGNDRLYGGTGLDRLIDSLGTNTKYAEFGPDYNVSASGFTAFDWFDRNLKDGNVRSIARESLRNGVLERSDMLRLYTVIATDDVFSVIRNNGTVNSNEFSDLKSLTSTRMNMAKDARYFAKMVVNGDRANGWYERNALGNLAAGVRGDHLDKLVDKWFLGGDEPGLPAGVVYQRSMGQLFVGGASHTDISQGSVNNCYFLAALGEGAEHSPSTIRNMFADNGDGTFTVRFFRDGKAAYVTVNSMLPVWSANTFNSWGSDHRETGEMWVALAEKAYAQVNESGWIGQDGTNTYVGIDFGHTSKALSHLTGKSASNSDFADQSDKDAFMAAIRAGKCITLSSRDSGVNTFVVANHAYQVIGYNSETRLFELYNPHGNNSSTDTPESLFVSYANIRHDFSQWTSVLV